MNASHVSLSKALARSSSANTYARTLTASHNPVNIAEACCELATWVAESRVFSIFRVAVNCHASPLRSVVLGLATQTYHRMRPALFPHGQAYPSALSFPSSA